MVGFASGAGFDLDFCLKLGLLARIFGSESEPPTRPTRSVSRG